MSLPRQGSGLSTLVFTVPADHSQPQRSGRIDAKGGRRAETLLDLSHSRAVAATVSPGAEPAPAAVEGVEALGALAPTHQRSLACVLSCGTRPFPKLRPGPLSPAAFAWRVALVGSQLSALSQLACCYCCFVQTICQYGNPKYRSKAIPAPAAEGEPDSQSAV